MTVGDVITGLVNARLIEEVPEEAVSDRSHLIADQMLVSVAISLKRIADCLSGFDFAIIDNGVQTIAWNAGRSFEAGRRQ